MVHHPPVGLRVTDDNGLTNTTTVTFHVNHFPTARFDVTMDPPVRNEPVEFDASGSFDTDGTVETYEWDWDDDGSFDATTTSETINHTYTTGGDKTVTLRVTDDDNASNTTAVSFHVQIRVDVAVKPTTEPNPINQKRNTMVLVMIENTSTFDPGRVNVSSLRFGDRDDVTVDNDAGASPVHAGGHYEDVDGDGDLDLVVHFRTSDAGFESDDTDAIVVGLTADGVKLFGTDSVKIVGGGGGGAGGGGGLP